VWDQEGSRQEEQHKTADIQENERDRDWADHQAEDFMENGGGREEKQEKAHQKETPDLLAASWPATS